MYFDTLRQTASASQAVSNISFMDVMDEAMACTEVHSEASIGLIMAEAEFVGQGSEASSDWWAKIKATIRKMWEALKKLLAKIITFVKSIPGRLMNLARKIATRWQTMGIEKRLSAIEKNKAGFKLKPGVKLSALEATGLDAMTKTILDTIDGASSLDLTDADLANGDKTLEKLKAEIGKFEENATKTPVKNLSAEPGAIRAVFNDVAKGTLTKVFEKDAENVKKVVAKIDKGTDAIAKKYDKAYKSSNEEEVKKITKGLSLYRRLGSIVASYASKLQVFGSKVVLSHAKYVNAAVHAWVPVAKKEPAAAPAK
jgi:hypothetical protein